jgi:hypothetical protein
LYSIKGQEILETLQTVSGATQSPLYCITAALAAGAQRPEPKDENIDSLVARLIRAAYSFAALFAFVACTGSSHYLFQTVWGLARLLVMPEGYDSTDQSDGYITTTSYKVSSLILNV